MIDALVTRATRRDDVGLSAYKAFQSSIELQEKVAAQTRDLEIAADELQALRYDQERIRTSLDDALASMEDGFALFSAGELAICNDLFRNLLPDIAHLIQPGLLIDTYLDSISSSRDLKSLNRPLDIGQIANHAGVGLLELPVQSYVLERAPDRWFQIRIQPMQKDRTVILISDITAIVRQNRDEKETLIDAQADYLQAVFEDIRSGVCTFSQAGEVRMFNGPFRELLGLPYALLQQGTALTRIVDYARQHRLLPRRSLVQLSELRRAVAAKGSFATRIDQGGRRILDLTAHRLPDGGFLIELSDVTFESQAKATLELRVTQRTEQLTRANERLTAQSEVQARVEEELRLAKERAEAAVSSKTRFLAAVSHDLLQPINAAKLTVDILRQDTAGSPTETYVRRLERALGSTEQILHALLDISRLDSPGPGTFRPSRVTLGAVMQRVFEDQLALAEQRNVSLRMVPCSAVVDTDPTYILRSMQNLLVNAIQYNRPGGRVLMGCRRRNATVLFQVLDTGPGIAPEDQARIFNEFARGAAAEDTGGLGLGLSVVDRACRHLGHKLWLRSEPGKGALFCIEMAEVARAPALQRLDPVKIPTGDLPDGFIALVIENDADALLAMTEILERWGGSVLAARSSEEGMRQIEEIGLLPDIVLADYQLDNGDTGLEFLSRLAAQQSAQQSAQVPAVLVSANREDSLFEECRARGVPVVTKPVDPARLRTVVAASLRGRAQPM